MKVNGKVISGPRIVTVDMPTDDRIVTFKFRALKFTEKFEEVVPRPEPPQVVKPGVGKSYNFEDKGYKTAFEQWVTNKLHWELLKSIDVTEDLEWSTVKMDDPTTWKNWETEIEEHFGLNGKNRLFQGFTDAQYITEETVERARKAFLTGLQAHSA